MNTGSSKRGSCAVAHEQLCEITDQMTVHVSTMKLTKKKWKSNMNDTKRRLHFAWSVK